MVQFHDIFHGNQKKVYDILFTIFRAAEYWGYFKTSRKYKQGRKLLLALYEHYLGPNKVDHCSASLTRTLQNLNYHGKKKNWNFEKYQAAHLEQHNISVGLEEHSYSDIDDRAKVRYLFDGIKNDKLEVIKTQVIAFPDLRQYFAGVCSLFSDYIKQCEGMNHPVRNISEVSAGSGCGGRGGSGRVCGSQGGQEGRGGDKVPPPTSKEIAACTHMSDQYLTDKNYKDLSQAKNSRLWQIRKKKAVNGSNPSPPPSMANQVKRNIGELKVTLRDLGRGMDPNDEDNCSVAMMITFKSIPETLHLLGRRPVGIG